MLRLSILPVLLIGLPLIGCMSDSSLVRQNVATVAVPGSEGTPTGSFVRGADPDRLVVTSGRDQIDQTAQSSASDILAHTATAPFVTLHH